MGPALLLELKALGPFSALYHGEMARCDMSSRDAILGDKPCYCVVPHAFAFVLGCRTVTV